ncbi:ATP-dependent DNA helicase [Paramicrobacterium agarici]|uniref:DNA 3'-5' helicase n=1 Tax=Paramicrobacterium agarici TaxID=630514 RepID=A0A2A9DZT8_9MICO|nr:ATP-dependent DNA helicase [Microbacterium agarici]PFG31645.1 DNA helicase-2/ATP-dependent DNA helicase PcrA [Microbacterium agarici]TQO21549.1 DNA helicase-2/ATP-dependent DNA helicase PcrA [Microbacterium agarici]
MSAREIAERLGLPRPTDEQVAVIEAPLEPALVVAGAGSGKTETMANRIVWLLANDHITVSQVLGLTFTRKAAGELATRVRERIAQLREIDGRADDVLEAPTISTYNAFAAALFREHGRLIGREPDVTVISAASAWTLARDIIVSSDDARLAELDKSVDAITSAVVRVAHALSDNDALTEIDGIGMMCDEFSGLATLPINDDVSRKRTPDKGLTDACRDVAALPVLLEHARRFHDEKRARGFIEFSDQVALALQITRTIEHVPEEYRERFRVVILDEYQDTSVVQTELLSRLFAGHGVMAVGDPNQSIYGWRGASASNLARFSVDFGGRRSYSLSTSWRNARTILDAANVLVSELPSLPDAPVTRLSPSPVATPGSVEIRFPETIDDEADEVAAWFAERLSHPGQSAALLCRSLKTVRPFTLALERHDVPYHVLGLAGLLEQPVVVDLVCTLRVLDDPTAGSELIRLLTGARWRVGTKDIAGLREAARWLAERDLHQQRVPDETRQLMRESVADDDGASLVDALDFLVTAPDDHRALSGITEVGRERMRSCGAVIARLRRRSGLALNDLVNLVVQELRLDIEVAANATNALGRSSLEAFSDQIAAYLAVDERGALGPFLAWLAEAEKLENLSPRTEDPEPGTVQILTIHGAKGLEWDSVAVPRLVDGELPSKLRSKRGWTAFGELPYAFRGDRFDLPELAWRGAQNQQDFVRASASFGEALERRDAEEQRRLAYVAVTRARTALLASGSFWASQKRPRGPGVFLADIHRAVPTAIAALPVATELDENPLAIEVEPLPWPRDPLGARRAAVLDAAQAVRQADPAAETPWDDEIALLLAERERKLTAGSSVALPQRVPASRFKDYVTDPDAVAAALRRPMPERPYRQTRLGTLFHSWVEERSGLYGGSETLDSELFEADIDVDETGTLAPVERAELEALESLKRTFERSEWGDKQPIDVEREINFVLAGQVIICKLDAVYRTETGYQIVDWKTGKPPRTREELEDRQLQLALYRAAYAQAEGIDPSTIDAALYYVADDLIVRPDHVSSEEELRSRWLSSLSRS